MIIFFLLSQKEVKEFLLGEQIFENDCFPTFVKNKVEAFFGDQPYLELLKFMPPCFY